MTGSVLWHAYQAAAATGGTLLGPAEWAATGLSNDTRSLRAGDLFVALKAARDGHAFVAAAFERGAAAALVSDPVEGAGPQLVVPDTMRALEALAAAARDRSFAPLIGVTGSAGKTTTKEMLRHALSPLGEVHAAEKSFNNHIGVPLTLAELPPSARVGVVEMGMNHAGEIRGLTTQVRPHIALITTIAEAHIEFLGSLEAIADAKAEIAEGLRPGGLMILPADSPFLDRLRTRCAEAGVANIATFGRQGQDARLLAVAPAEGGQVVDADIRGQKVRFTLAASGEHMATNALAALLAAVAAGVPAADAAEALSSFRSGAGRGESFRLRLGDRTITVLDESYNANPSSMRASLAVLGGIPGRKVAVLGDMLELGPDAPRYHAELAGACAVADVVHTAGPLMRYLRDALPEARRGEHADQAEALLKPLLSILQDGDTVLFKGSNGSRVGALIGGLTGAGQRL